MAFFGTSVSVPLALISGNNPHVAGNNKIYVTFMFNLTPDHTDDKLFDFHVGGCDTNVSLDCLRR
jgi:hypothetical protein